ncbi:MAG: MmcQ/YjbR family DNA-binding protein [Crocinitomicaceae bacterium]|tara:strand:+ start:215 stop:559 length:345 start_codon:yes stop_codon:yes gene_type:complete
MNVESFRDYCLSKHGATESFPFDQNTIAFKIGGKLFALAGIELFASINLKCDPERSLELRETYSGIKPGFHMNKKHWNTLTVESDVPNQLLFELIDHSLDLVYKSLTKKIRDGL